MDFLFVEWELREFSRMANAAYASGRNDIGHKFSVLSATARGVTYPAPVFDTIMAQYREWLVFGNFPPSAA